MTRTTFKIVIAALCLSVFVSATAAQAQPTAPEPDRTVGREIADPIEPVNRFIFGFNDILDRMLIEPVARGYRAILPTFVRDAVQSFMRNLQSPLIIANNILQGDIGGAGVATARFLINSTVGIVGLVDVADSQGLRYEDEDFGQTMAKWGVGNGFYLVLPVIGPSSLRDTAGLAVDTYADPVRIIAHNTDNEWIYYTRVAVKGIDTRARMIPAIDDLRRNSIDYYAAARSAYGQRRESLVRDERSGRVAEAVSYTDYQ